MSIKFTAACWHEIKSKLPDIYSLQILFQNIELNRFNSKIDSLFIIFQVFPKDYPARTVKEYKSVKRKTNTLELYLVLDYDRIMQSPDSENMEYIKQVFLQGCETFLKPLKNFDYTGFMQQIKTCI